MPAVLDQSDQSGRLRMRPTSRSGFDDCASRPDRCRRMQPRRCQTIFPRRRTIKRVVATLQYQFRVLPLCTRPLLAGRSFLDFTIGGRFGARKSVARPCAGSAGLSPLNLESPLVMSRLSILSRKNMECGEADWIFIADAVAGQRVVLLLLGWAWAKPVLRKITSKILVRQRLDNGCDRYQMSRAKRQWNLTSVNVHGVPTKIAGEGIRSMSMDKSMGLPLGRVAGYGALFALLFASPALALKGEEVAKNATITVSAVRAATLNAHPGRGTGVSLEKQKDGGRLCYTFDIKTASSVQEGGVGAMTGKVLDNAPEGKNPD